MYLNRDNTTLRQWQWRWPSVSPPWKCFALSLQLLPSNSLQMQSDLNEFIRNQNLSRDIYIQNNVPYLCIMRPLVDLSRNRGRYHQCRNRLPSELEKSNIWRTKATEWRAKKVSIEKPQSMQIWKPKSGRRTCACVRKLPESKYTRLCQYLCCDFRVGA